MSYRFDIESYSKHKIHDRFYSFHKFVRKSVSFVCYDYKIFKISYISMYFAILLTLVAHLINPHTQSRNKMEQYIPVKKKIKISISKIYFTISI